MRFLYLLALCLSLVSDSFSQPVASIIDSIPNPRKTNGSWIYQEVDMLQDRYADINGFLDSLERETSAEVAVVVLASIGDNAVEDFATTLFNKWGIGKKEKNNGVLILHVLDQRKIRIEVGYDLEGALPDLICKRIIDEITVPYFKENNFPDGHYWMAKAVESYIREKPIADFASFAKDPVNARSVTLEEKNASGTGYVYELPANFELIVSLGLLSVVLLIVLVNGLFFFIGIWQKDPFKQYLFVKKREKYMARMIGPPLIGLGLYLFYTSWPFTAFGAFFVGFVSWRFFPWNIVLKKKNLDTLRLQSRVCSKCSGKMQMLKENQEDQYLTDVMQAQEKIGLIAYDVWACSCGNTRIDNYDSGVRARNCPKCKKPTYACVESQTLEAATSSSSGREKHCTNVGIVLTKMKSLSLFLLIPIVLLIRVVVLLILEAAQVEEEERVEVIEIGRLI